MRLCRHCDTVMAECDPECPRCGRNPLYDELWLSPKPRRFSPHTIVNEWLELSGRKKGRATLSAKAFRLLLVRYTLAALAAILLGVGAFQPLVRITSLGVYNLLRPGGFYRGAGSHCPVPRPSLPLYLSGHRHACHRPPHHPVGAHALETGNRLCPSLSLYIALMITFGYLFSMRYYGEKLTSQLAESLSVHGQQMITPVFEGVLCLMMGTLTLNIAHWLINRAKEG